MVPFRLARVSESMRSERAVDRSGARLSAFRESEMEKEEERNKIAVAVAGRVVTMMVVRCQVCAPLRPFNGGKDKNSAITTSSDGIKKLIDR